jgi:DNA-binding CsgD family transcriptional regulator
VEALASSPVVRAVDANGLSLLSKREMDVVRSLAEGLTNREIAERLGLSQHTIKNYLFRVYDKLGVSSRLELLFMTLTQAGSPAGHGTRDHHSPKAGTGAKGPRSRPGSAPEEAELPFRVSAMRRAEFKYDKPNEKSRETPKAPIAFVAPDPLD